MCGIAGFFNADTNYTSKKDYYEHILHQMGTLLHHRGPDDSGTHLSSHCGLSHTRLSIIDLDGGAQPMHREISDFQYHIIYNGEIYNLDMLRSRLKHRNVHCKTNSDTEVLLLSFLEFGNDFISYVDGIFAIAIYDERHETLSLFRDAFGVKPLFYTITQHNTFCFASEIKGILAYPDINPVLSTSGLNEIFGLGPARTPGCGVLKDIHELKPGTYLTISHFGIHETTYYRLTSHPHTDSYEDTIEKTRHLVTDAISRQMISDVPICTFLSGGVDSSLVSAVCANELKKKNQTLKTFSFDFTDNSQYFQANSFQPSMDRPYVDIMTEFLHSDHTYLECSNHTQADLLYDSVCAHDLPCMADIDSSLLYFCKQVAQSHKVVLTGECADEIFGGYPWFHRSDMLSCGTFPWTPDLTPRKSLLNPDLLKHMNMDEYVAHAYDTAVSEISVLPHENATETNRRRIGYLNIRFFMQTLLNRMDRTSMNAGLEARVPFADKTLIDYIFNTPWEMKAKNGVVKNVLRQACTELLPNEILFRKKSPYPKTYDPSYEQLLSGRLKEVLSDTSCKIRPLLNISAVNQFLENPKDYGQPWYGQLMAGPQMIAYLLQIEYWLTAYHISIQ